MTAPTLRLGSASGTIRAASGRKGPSRTEEDVMSSRKSVWMSLAIAPVLGALFAVPVASRAAEPAKHVKCEIMKSGKKETQQVKSAEECTKLGGKVVEAQKK
jgi:hypothetical protein